MIRKKCRNSILFLVIAVLSLPLMQGCVSTSKPKAEVKKTGKRYHLDHDKYPEPHEAPDISKIKDAKPKVEPKSKIGNPKSYTVFQKSYNVLPSSKGYKAKGKASWYGKKFHGYKTSNGDTYDMYGMSAAHKTLPLPTYARVKNLDNGKSIIVKINDRGPFHEDRIIDLSYAAASKLGILAKGTGHVEVEAIDPSLPNPQKYLQVAAFSKEANAKKLALQIQNITGNHPVEIRQQKSTNSKLYLVHIGPIQDETDVDELRAKLNKHKLPKPIAVLLE